MRKVFAMFLAVVLLFPCVNVSANSIQEEITVEQYVPDEIIGCQPPCEEFYWESYLFANCSTMLTRSIVNGEKSPWVLEDANADEAESIIYGDADGDGNVNMRDIALLQQYMAGWDVTIAPSADADGDGNLNMRDLALLQQYLAGWDVVLGAKANKDPIIYNQRYAAIDKETSGEISLVFTKDGQVWAYAPSAYDWENDEDDCVFMAYKTYECKDGYIYINGSAEPEFKISNDKQELLDADESLNRPGFKCTGEEIITDAAFKEGTEYRAVYRDEYFELEITVRFEDYGVNFWSETLFEGRGYVVPYECWDVVNKQHFSFESDGNTITFILTDGGNTLYIPEYMCVATLVEE